MGPQTLDLHSRFQSKTQPDLAGFAKTLCTKMAMTQETFLIDSFLLAILGILAPFVGAIISTYFIFNKHKNFIFLLIPNIIILIFSVVWAAYSATYPLEVLTTIEYDVKTVKFPNGKEIQMYTVNGEHKNANLEFGMKFSEGSKVKRIIYKKVYAGIRFENRQNDTYEPVIEE